MKLWELLFVCFFAPACWFGWQWLFRGLVIKMLVTNVKGAAAGMLGKNKEGGPDG